MNRFIISEQEKQRILNSHISNGYKGSERSNITESEKLLQMTEKKMETVSDLEKEIERLEKKLEDLKAKHSKKKETNEDEFDDLLNMDMDVEVERDSMEQD
jgi:alanyl-tRNA synthetase